MIFARRVFNLAAIYGFVSLIPMFFLERRLMERMPPALTHPEFYYGFAGVALAWQVLFVFIAREPARLRPAMLPAVLEKLSWGVAVLALVAAGEDRHVLHPRGGDRPGARGALPGVLAIGVRRALAFAAVPASTRGLPWRPPRRRGDIPVVRCGLRRRQAPPRTAYTFLEPPCDAPSLPRPWS